MPNNPIFNSPSKFPRIQNEKILKLNKKTTNTNKKTSVYP